ncbi:hypothetical protein CDAR_526051 [Caerostris darwini]|uniref:Uncharacterized protein n=1 Tax=Caerostris darwini TaxID=1538125 RepID=A0AAV4Q3N2_9ARAC|nr:hypothetical protein CDAR_526051 [Caerostris darwini]
MPLNLKLHDTSLLSLSKWISTLAKNMTLDMYKRVCEINKNTHKNKKASLSILKQHHKISNIMIPHHCRIKTDINCGEYRTGSDEGTSSGTVSTSPVAPTPMEMNLYR